MIGLIRFGSHRLLSDFRGGAFIASQPQQEEQVRLVSVKAARRWQEMLIHHHTSGVVV